MKLSHKRKINHKYHRENHKRLGPSASLIDAETIQFILNSCTYIGGTVALVQAPEAYRKVRNSFRRNVMQRFLVDSKNACKVKLLESGKVCNAPTKIIQIELKKRPLFARVCSDNPAHLVHADGKRIKLSDLSKEQQKELFELK
ncbi:hypothetical protein QDG88_13335 [Pseudoalteromonas piscicida]|uniref:hypothetical protein n=1 Tax=Pseudoalteromonas piscicida TaxID=43662 RepID=UPI002738F481|nr:hypothetical protein [Pseudoalteromonas piscicida]MDP4488904.1 hypothetical protein [Pseudoalteromonas piscicida]